MLTISAGVIYAGQVLGKDWSAREGADDHLWVNPLPPGFVERDEDIAYAWAACRSPRLPRPGGAITQWVLLTRAQIDKIRASSRAADSGPWVTNFPKWRRKSAGEAALEARAAAASRRRSSSRSGRKPTPKASSSRRSSRRPRRRGKEPRPASARVAPAHELTPAGDSIETGQTDLEEAIANAPPRADRRRDRGRTRGAPEREEEEGLTSEVRPRGRVDRLRPGAPFSTVAFMPNRFSAAATVSGSRRVRRRGCRLRLLRRELLRCLDRRLPGVKVTQTR